METMPYEIECTVGKAQIHYSQKDSEHDLVLELDACSRRKQEEQREQQNDDDSAVNVCHTVSDIGVCGYHQSAEKIKKTGLQSVIRLYLTACRRTVLEYQICRDGNGSRSSCCKNAGYGKTHCGTEKCLCT